MVIVKSNIKFIGLVYPLTLILVTLSTFLIRTFGPIPYIDPNNTWVSNPDFALEEPRDSFILLSWWLISLIILLIFLKVRIEKVQKNIILVSGVTVQFIGIVLIYISSAWSLDSRNISDGLALWTGVKPNFILYSAIFLIIAFYLFLNRQKLFFGLLIKLVFLSIFVYMIINVIQFPLYLDDQNHFNFVGNDLLIGVAGKTALHNYFPVYSNLLSYLLNPVVNYFPNFPVQITVYFLIFLQILVILMSYKLLKLVIPRSLFLISFVFFLIPLFATSATGKSPLSYFPIHPLRIFLPLVCFLAIFYIIFKNKSPNRIFLFLVGFLMGINIINNLEFGATASLSILITLVIFYGINRKMLYTLLPILIGILSFIFLFYISNLLAKTPVDFTSMFIFMRLTLSGYYAIAMDFMGIHLIIVSLFISGFAIGTYFLIKYRNINSIQSRRYFLLTLLSIWGLGSLPYFSGRSLPSTLIGGLAFHYSFVFALLVPLLFTSFKFLKSNLLSKLPLAVTSLLSLSVVFSGLFTVNDPLVKFGQFKDFKSESWDYYSQKAQVLFYLNDSEDKTVKNLLNDNSLSQILLLSNAYSSQLGLPSELITNHPWHLEVTPAYSSLQCQFPGVNEYKYVLTTQNVNDTLLKNSDCLTVYDFDKTIKLTEIESNLVVMVKK
jgi:hypothetical protein